MSDVSRSHLLSAPGALLESLGRRTVKGIGELGYACSLFVECFYWLLVGKQRRQAVRLSAIFQEAMTIGVNAALIASLLCFAVGIMLAIQGIETLRQFGAESTVIMGIAISITREFSPLIVSILVAGRSGSAITARIGTMQESQEIDALRVIGISPVRFLAAPILIGMLVMLPTLTILGDVMGILGGAVYTSLDLNINMAAYTQRTLDVLTADDIQQGLIKSVVFAAIIALVGLINGFQVSGGAEGVGKATTRSVVLSISFIILADMVFTYILNR
ncbi:MAG: ABC transporter [Gammaproteobacteria bacterium SG8_11]|nr:MAG: ABC transporter [Gammaproteobacteria bacterium SG8_11]